MTRTSIEKCRSRDTERLPHFYHLSGRRCREDRMLLWKLRPQTLLPFSMRYSPNPSSDISYSIVSFHFLRILQQLYTSCVARVNARTSKSGSTFRNATPQRCRRNRDGEPSDNTQARLILRTDCVGRRMSHQWLVPLSPPRTSLR